MIVSSSDQISEFRNAHLVLGAKLLGKYRVINFSVIFSLEFRVDRREVASLEPITTVRNKAC